jgi:branched-chain amino acid transport system substrate-binding protein
MGLKVAQGLQLLEAFYWDINDDTRAFAKRFAARPGMNGKMPSGNQAGVYASTLAYLNAVAATGSDQANDVVPEMKKFKGKDKLFGDVTVRQDGCVIHPMYLFEVKKPEESKYPYDDYGLISTIPADQAFRPIADGGRALVNHPTKKLSSPSAPIRILQIQIPAPRCSRPGSSRRCSQRPARHAPARSPAAPHPL